MIISHEYSFIFIHVPKAAGTSVEKSLCPAVGIPVEFSKYNPEIIHAGTQLKDDIPSWVSNTDIRGNINCKHIRARDLKRLLNEEQWKQYYKFAFVRNPYDRLVSFYFWAIQYEHRARAHYRRYSTFKDFVYALHQKETGCLPMCWFLADDAGNLLTDKIYKFEEINRDYQSLCRRLKVAEHSLPVGNASRHRNYREYYTKETAEIIFELYRQDFELLSYCQNSYQM